ncbi:MAG TPA: septum formation initiator family protein [Candidatus Limnocylindria bacterium]|nr:septum formation initiator family protein [Candidatus Limnocylindria bacterium]
MSGSPKADPGHRIDFLEWLNRILIVCLALAGLAWMGLKFAPAINKDRRLNEELQRKEETAAKLAAEHQRNRAKIEALKTNPHAIEKAIRERLGYGRSNELIVTFSDSVPTNTPVPTPATNRTRP